MNLASLLAASLGVILTLMGCVAIAWIAMVIPDITASDVLHDPYAVFGASLTLVFLCGGLLGLLLIKNRKDIMRSLRYTGLSMFLPMLWVVTLVGFALLRAENVTSDFLEGGGLITLIVSGLLLFGGLGLIFHTLKRKV